MLEGLNYTPDEEDEHADQGQGANQDRYDVLSFNQIQKMMKTYIPGRSFVSPFLVRLRKVGRNDFY